MPEDPFDEPVQAPPQMLRRWRNGETADRRCRHAANIALLSMSSVLLSGCAFAPSIPLFGAVFPDWLFCIVGGVAGTILAHLALSRRGENSALAPFVISYPALSALFAMAAWLIFFSRW